MEIRGRECKIGVADGFFQTNKIVSATPYDLQSVVSNSL